MLRACLHLIRVRVGDPERIIEVPGCVDGEELDVIAGSVFKLVREKGLAHAACIPKLTV